MKNLKVSSECELDSTWPLNTNSPVNFLDHTQHKGLAVAVFGVLLCKLWGLVISPSPLPFTDDTHNKREAATCKHAPS